MYINKNDLYDIQYYTSNASANDFYANSLSDYLEKYLFEKLTHKHSFYITMLFTAGSGDHIIDSVRYPVKPGVLFTLLPGQVHRLNVSDDCKGYIIFHTTSFFDLNMVAEKIADYPFFNSGRSSPLMQLSKKNLIIVKSMFRSITEEFSCERLMKYRKISSLLNILYIELSRLHPTELLVADDTVKYSKKIKQLNDLIDQNYIRIKSAGEYARMMNMSDKHLNRICKDCLNRTTTEHITEKVILEAKRLMVHSDFSLSEIAEQLGYFENSYFFRIFKKFTGDTPTEFMKKHRTSEVLRANKHKARLRFT